MAGPTKGVGSRGVIVWTRAVVMNAGVAAAVLAIPVVGAAQEDALGQEVYDRWCAGCHGVDGDGNGPAADWMLPRPRDFTLALYQIRTTASGDLPTDEDILKVIDEGMPGTTMPGWEGVLSNSERQAVLEYVKSFSRFFGQGDPPTPLDFGSPPSLNEEALATGREIYERAECFKCHGDAGRGNGGSAPTLEDDNDIPIRAADLTENWMFNGGGSVEDIYRRMRTGLDGTPMPSQSDLLDAGVVTEEELWNLAQYVRDLSPEEPPRIREVISADLVEGELPELADEMWNEVERFYIPLVGQIIVEPRWFDPRVDGVWAQALHDGVELALRITWEDPSLSPDTLWAEWQARVLELMHPREGDDLEPGPRPDQLVVQFPAELPDGRERPYFLGGDSRRPVYLWRWRSDDPDGATEMTARGLGSEQAQPASSQNVGVAASFDEGRWSVLFRRSLVTTDQDDELEFVRGQPIPVAFFAWDGDNGEWGSRGAISSWYFVYLRDATPVTVYVAPTLALLLTASLGFFVVARAQRRERELHSQDGSLEEESTTEE